MTTEKLGREVSPDEPCDLCGTDDWCFRFPDNSIACRRPEKIVNLNGWTLSKKKTKDGCEIYHPVRTEVKPRFDRELPKWKRVNSDSTDKEIEIVFQYSPTQRVLRRQWTDRRKAYGRFKKGKEVPEDKWKTKSVLPQYLDAEAGEWKFGKGPDRWPLYRIQEVKPDDVLFVVGGEICVDTMRKFGFSATCHQGGEGSYTTEIVKDLKSSIFKLLVIIPDNDDAGLSAAKSLMEAMALGDQPTAILPPSELYAKADAKWDVADWDIAPEEAREVIISAVSKLKINSAGTDSDELNSENLRSAALEYSGIKDPFDRYIKAADIKKQFGVSPSKLEELAVEAVKPEEPPCSHMLDALGKVFNDLENPDLVDLGIPTGFKELDQLTIGCQPGDLILIGARPGMGKTSFMLSCAFAAAETGKTVYVYSLEMTIDQLTYRALSMRSGISYGDLKRKSLSTSDWESLGQAIASLGSLPIYLDESQGATVNDLEMAIDKLEIKPDVIMIDYIQLMDGPGHNDTARVSAISRRLKGMARSMGIPIVVLSQLSRGVESRQDKRPNSADLRDSGQLEQDATSIWMIYRDEMYNDETTDRGIAEIIITKNRNGPTGTVKLLFASTYTSFKDLH